LSTISLCAMKKSLANHYLHVNQTKFDPDQIVHG
jgi:hypothetical protein